MKLRELIANTNKLVKEYGFTKKNLTESSRRLRELYNYLVKPKINLAEQDVAIVQAILSEMARIELQHSEARKWTEEKFWRRLAQDYLRSSHQNKQACPPFIKTLANEGLAAAQKVLSALQPVASVVDGKQEQIEIEGESAQPAATTDVRVAIMQAMKKFIQADKHYKPIFERVNFNSISAIDTCVKAWVAQRIQANTLEGFWQWLAQQCVVHMAKNITEFNEIETEGRQSKEEAKVEINNEVEKILKVPADRAPEIESSILNIKKQRESQKKAKETEQAEIKGLAESGLKQEISSPIGASQADIQVNNFFPIAKNSSQKQAVMRYIHAYGEYFQSILGVDILQNIPSQNFAKFELVNDVSIIENTIIDFIDDNSVDPVDIPCQAELLKKWNLQLKGIKNRALKTDLQLTIRKVCEQTQLVDYLQAEKDYQDFETLVSDIAKDMQVYRKAFWSISSDRGELTVALIESLNNLKLEFPKDLLAHPENGCKAQAKVLEALYKYSKKADEEDKEVCCRNMTGSRFKVLMSKRNLTVNENVKQSYFSEQAKYKSAEKKFYKKLDGFSSLFHSAARAEAAQRLLTDAKQIFAKQEITVEQKEADLLNELLDERLKLNAYDKNIRLFSFEFKSTTHVLPQSVRNTFGIYTLRDIIENRIEKILLRYTDKKNPNPRLIEAINASDVVKKRKLSRGIESANISKIEHANLLAIRVPRR